MIRSEWTRRPIGILAVGSPHGDDQAGWGALDLLRAESLAGIEVVALAGPLDLLDHLPRFRAVILLDACRSGSRPGTIIRVDGAPPLDHPACASSHGLGLAAALALAESLGTLLPPLTLFGIEVAACAPGADLSDAVRAALPELCRQVLEVVRVWLGEGAEFARTLNHA